VNGQSVAVAEVTPAATPTQALELKQGSSTYISDVTRAATGTNAAQQLVDEHSATAVDTAVTEVAHNDYTPVAVTPSSNPSVEESVDMPLELLTTTTNDDLVGTVAIVEQASDGDIATTTPTTSVVDKVADDVVVPVVKPSATPQALVRTHASVHKPQYATKLTVEQWEQPPATSNIAMFQTSAPESTDDQLPKLNALEMLQYKAAPQRTKAPSKGSYHQVRRIKLQHC
jgi:hypothetical protein